MSLSVFPAETSSPTTHLKKPRSDSQKGKRRDTTDSALFDEFGEFKVHLGESECDDVSIASVTEESSEIDTNGATRSTIPSEIPSGLGFHLVFDEHFGNHSMGAPPDELYTSRPFIDIPCAVVMFRDTATEQEPTEVTQFSESRTIAFKVVLQHSPSLRVTTLKRYSDFVALHDTLSKKSHNKNHLPKLPERSFFSTTNNSRRRVEERRIALRRYLQGLPLPEVLFSWAPEASVRTAVTTRDAHGIRVHTVCRYIPLVEELYPLEVHLPFAHLRFIEYQECGEDDHEIVVFFRPGEGAVHVAPRYREITDLVRWMESCGDLIPDSYETHLFLQSSFNGQTLCPICGGPTVAAMEKHGKPCPYPGHTWVASAKSLRSQRKMKRKHFGAFGSRRSTTVRHTVQSPDDPTVFVKTSLCTCDMHHMCCINGRVNRYEFQISLPGPLLCEETPSSCGGGKGSVANSSMSFQSDSWSIVSPSRENEKFQVIIIPP